MTFLNVLLLGGVAAVAAPIIIHLFHKSRHRKVRWGAMHLLEPVIRQNQRRIRMEQWLLLLLRCLVPVLLALAMARPVFTGLKALLGESPASIVILLDDSYSMAGSSGGTTAFARSTETARQILEGLPRGSEVGVVLMGGSPRILPPGATFDLGGLSKRLGELSPTYGTAKVEESLETAAGVLGTMHQPDREIVILSDMQQAGWQEQTNSNRETILQRLRSMPIPPRLVMIPTGQPLQNNVAIESAEYTKLRVGVGQPLQFRVNLRNHGTSNIPSARVTFSVDGKELEHAEIPLTAGETGQVLFSHRFQTDGSHIVRFRSGADALEPDNEFTAAIPVWKQVPVLLVNGDPAREPMTGETDYLELALQPLSSAKTGIEDLVSAKTIQPRELNAKALEGIRVVVLANVQHLEDGQLNDLQNFVSLGGGLLVMPGNRIDTQRYNGALLPRGLLPLPIAGLKDESRGNPASILSQHFDHAALEFFNDPRNGSLGEIQATRWYTFGPAAQGTPAEAIRTLARLDSGDALFVEKNLGEGVVMISAIPGDADWSNLPLRPAFVPLMQRLATHLAATIYPPRNLVPGEPLVSLLPADAAGKKAVVAAPSGAPVEVEIQKTNTGSSLRFLQTWQPGVYALTLPGGEVVHYTVNAERAESSLILLDETQINATAQNMEATRVANYEEYRGLDSIRRHGREFWKPLLFALLAALFIEQLITAKLSHRKRRPA